MESSKPLLDAEWTDDCQGKKDYDGNIVYVSTRYWPRGGSYMLINTTDGSITDSSDTERQKAIRPSATSSLIIPSKELSGRLELIKKDFVADTEEEVKEQVEEWAQIQMDRVVSALKKEFSI